MIRRVLFFILLLTAVPVRGNDSVYLPADSLLRAGIHHLYNQDHDSAIDHFRILRNQYPEHPIGYFMDGVAAWMNTRGTHGVKPSEDTLLTRMRSSAEISKAYVQNHPSDEYGWLIYGMSLGAQARVDLARKHWLQAAIHGLKGIRRIQKAEEINPDLPDLQLALGAFHYYVGMSGPLLKTAAGILGLSGTKEEGLAELQFAVNNCRYGTPQAKDILVYVYGYLEDRVPEALQLAEELSATYPKNPYYLALEADLHFAKEQVTEAEEAMTAIPPLLAEVDTFYVEEYENKLMYLRGLLNYHQGDYEESIVLLNRYIHENVDEYDLHAVNAELYLGKSYQRLHQMIPARRYFVSVSKSDVPTRMKAEARELLNQI